MLRRLRSIGPVLGILVLAIFAAWIGAASFHHHGSSIHCDICKVLHSSHAALPDGAPRLARDLAAQRQDAPAPLVASSGEQSPPRGRSPPAA
jgi:hypothetical protein